MSFIFTCPNCGRKNEAEDEWEGQRAACPHCHKTIAIEKPKIELRPVQDDSIELKPVANHQNQSPDEDSLDGEIIAAKSQGFFFNEDNTELLVAPKDITSFAIPKCVRAIGLNAFNGCKKLVSVTIPDSVASIGDFAFANCESLLEISMPKSIEIGEHAFEKCTSLERAVMSNSVITIGKGAFAACTSLTEIIIPNSITTISSGTFFGCTSLVKVTIPDGIASIESMAFARCEKLTEVVIPSSVKSIGHSAFENCEQLKGITIPEGVTSIESWTFNGCSNLADVHIPNSVTSIGFYVFSECRHLENLKIFVKGMDYNAFQNCPCRGKIPNKNFLKSPTPMWKKLLNVLGWIVCFCIMLFIIGTGDPTGVVPILFFLYYSIRELYEHLEGRKERKKLEFLRAKHESNIEKFKTEKEYFYNLLS